MPITVTSAVIESMLVRYDVGVASEIVVSYIGIDSNGDTFGGHRSFTPTPTQQTNIDNFTNALITQVQNATGLTITLNPV